jgi:hypothetical protein
MPFAAVEVPTLSTWTQYCVTWETGSQVWYKDGAVLDTGNDVISMAGQNNYNLGESHSGGGSGWNGLIDEVSLWNKVLTAAQVTELYNGGSPGSDQQYPYTAPQPPGSNVTAGGCPTGFSCNLTFNGSNGQWIYQWNDTLNSMQSTELQVYGYLGNFYGSVGTNTSTDFSGTVYLDTFMTYENQTTKAFVYLTDTSRTFPGAAITAMIMSGSHYGPTVLNHSVYGPNLVIDEPEGVFWSIFIIGTMVLMSFASPSTAIVMLLVGLFGVSQLGLFALNPGTLTLLVLLGIICMWRLSR